MTAIRTALVDDAGVVVDVVMTDPTASWEPPAGQSPYQLEDDSPVGRGWTCDGSTFTPPAQPGPEPAAQLPTVIELAAKNADLQAQVDALMDLMLGA